MDCSFTRFQGWSLMRRFIVCLLAIGTAMTDVTPGVMAQQAATAPQPAAGTPRLSKLPVPAARAKEIATQLSLRYRDIPGVSISPDPRNEQLVVMAPDDTQSQIATDLQRLMESAVQPAMSTQPGPLQVNLTSITWREFEDGIQQVVGKTLPVTTSRNGERASFQLNTETLKGTLVEVDRRVNSVTIVAPIHQHASWQKLIRAIDQQSNDRGEVTELIRVDKAEPAPIQRAIRLLHELEQAHAQEKRAAAEQSRGGSVFRNAVFQAPAAQPPAGADLDAPQPELEDGAEGGAGIIGGLDIQFVEELGVIIVRGARRDVERVRGLIAEIEAQSELTRPKVEVQRLEHTDSNAIADLLSELYEDVLSARQGEVSITALDTPNALLLIGREEAIKTVLDLIEKLDQPIADSDRLRVFRLQHASAIDAEDRIREFFVVRPGTDQDVRGGTGVRVRVLADYRTNSLIISASPRDMQEVTRLINQLDVEHISAKNEIKIIKLNNARAEDLATTIQSAITGDGEPQDNENVTRPSTTLSIVALDADGEQILDSGILAGVIVTADSNSNSLVIRGPASSMPLIRELIRQLDRAPGIDSLVKVFTIQHGDATQLTTALQNLFGADAATAGTTVGAANLPPASAAESSLVPLRFTTDIRSNSIITSGSAADLEVVESLLLRLDSEGFAERITEVIWLRHQVSDNVALAIQNYVNQRRTGQTSILQFQQGGLGPYDLVDRDLIVVSEFQTNSLILSVAPRLYEEVRRLIDHLDRRPPMVLIKVIIAEVDLDDRFEIGGDLGLQDSLLFDRGIASLAPPQSTPGFNFNNVGLPNLNTVGRDNLAARGLSSFGVGTTSSVAGVGGFVLSAASESVSMLFRTLQTAGRLQVISRPQVMVMDNLEAVVTVGQQIARPSSVNVTVNATSIGVDEIDVGLILRVIPRVGSDGLIVMAIDATRSQINNTAPGQAIGVFDGQPVTVQPIDQTTAQSTISAYSGQTVIFGGLIQKGRENTTRRMPYLSNIPLLGYLFKFDVETEFRSELLIVMTPMLVTGEQDLEYVKATESSRMSWCLADVVEAHGDVGLQGGYGLWGPTIGPTIYPDLQPTVDDIINGYQLKRRDSKLFGDEIEAPIVPIEPLDVRPRGEPVLPGPTSTLLDSMLNDTTATTSQGMLHPASASSSPPAAMQNSQADPSRNRVDQVQQSSYSIGNSGPPGSRDVATSTGLNEWSMIVEQGLDVTPTSSPQRLGASPNSTTPPSSAETVPVTSERPDSNQPASNQPASRPTISPRSWIR